MLRAVKWLLGALLLAFALDLALDLGPGARLAVVGGLMLAAAAVAGWSYYVAHDAGFPLVSASIPATVQP